MKSLKIKKTFFNSLSSKSFFENEKCLVIKKVSEKIKDIIDEIIIKKYEDFTLISRLRNVRKKI